MNFKNIHLTLFVIFAFGTGLLGASKADEESLLGGVTGKKLYVSTSGKAGNSGTFAEPFGTLEEARNAIRVLKATKSVGPIDVVIGGGVYELAKTLQFTVADSGTEQAPITYRAADGEHVVISGGRRIRGHWSTDDGKIYYVDIPEAKGGRWKFKQLFVDGQRSIRSRYPNGNNSIKVIAAGGDRISLHLAPGTAKQSWAHAPDAVINIVAEAGWFNEIVEVASVSDDGAEIIIKGKEAQGEIRKGNYFFIEGVLEELDQPGEWYLDSAAGRLYYWPVQGDPNQAEIIAPVIDRAVEFAGDRLGAGRVQWITLQGLIFTNLDYSIGHVAMRTTQDAAVRMMNTWNCSIKDCKFTNIGGYGVWLHLDSRYNKITGNEMVHTGSGGVLATSARFAYATDDMVYDPDPLAASWAPLQNEITSNHIHQGGEIRRYCAGVHLDSRPLATALEAGNRVAHNHIHDMPRNGIFAFANQGGNIFEYNHIHDVIQQVDDGGAIHMATMNSLAAPIIVKGNLIHDIGHLGEVGSSLTSERDGDRNPRANGVYLDWFTSNVTIQNNIVYNTSRGGIKLLGGDNLQVTNNIVGNDTQILLYGCYFGVRRVSGITIENNIFFSDSPEAALLFYSSNRQRSQSAGALAPSPQEIAKNPQMYAHSDSNVFWTRTGPVKLSMGQRDTLSPDNVVLSFKEWQITGADRSSISADPLFVDSGHGNFLLKPGSPALKLGFKPIDTNTIGPWGHTPELIELRSLGREATIIGADDAAFVRSNGSTRERVVVAGQSHTFLTQLVIESSSVSKNYIRFNPPLRSAGVYEIWVRWFDSLQGNTNKASLTVGTPQGDKIIAIDQTQEGLKWMRVGAYSLDTQASLTFSISASNKVAVVNAIALVRLP
jgi:parallel beta-helix repeat protein